MGSTTACALTATMLSTQAFGDNGKMRYYHNAGPVEHRFSPYTFNGGTVLAVAGEDFAIVASDTRLSEGYSIHSRDSPKCYKLTDTYKAGGSASAMLQPLLDNQIGFKNMEGVQHVPLTQDKAARLVKDVFISAAERDVYTGDALRLCTVTKEGIKEETFPLRKD